MKNKLLISIIVIVVVLLLVRIIFYTPSELEQKDLLTISAFVIDENVDYLNDNYDVDKVNFEKLELNKVRILTTINSRMWNISIRLESECGIIEIISDDKDVQFSVGENGEAWRYPENPDANRIYGFNLRVASGTYVAAAPLNASGGSINQYVECDGVFASKIEGYIGRESYLTVIAYDFANENAPVVTAKLRLVQLEDRYPSTLHPSRSIYFSIELISYEYSDMYELQK